MSRHRNIRSMNIQDEYEGFDDVYGHSVDDDYCVSPGTAAQFTYDRNNQNPLSSFMHTCGSAIREEEISEEDVSEEDHNDQTLYPSLSDLDQAKLNSCLEEMANITGDSISEQAMVDAILQSNFDCQQALDTVLTQNEAPKPQRQPRTRTLIVVQDQTNVTSPCQSVQNGGKVTSTEAAQPAVVFTVADDNTPSSAVKTHSDASAALTNTPVVTPKKEAGGDAPNTTPLLPKSASKAKLERLDVLKEYEKRKSTGKDSINMVVVGHVDAGKSTLMGHLLYQLGTVNKKTMHRYEQDSKKIGKSSFAFAWVLDETEEERCRGVTMDIAQTKFETPTKVITLLDAPGHKDFIPNMITGAAQADSAVLVINATKGEFESGFDSGGQTREHALLVRSLGVAQILVAVNKMDTVDWCKDRYDEIVRKLSQFLKQAGFKDTDISFVPCSGLSGENLVKSLSASAEANSSWYKGPALIELIDSFKSPERPIIDRPLRMCVVDVFKGMGSGFSIQGTIQSGSIQTADRVLIVPAGETAIVKAVTINDQPVTMGFAGDSVILTLTGVDIINVTVGSVICDTLNPMQVTSRFRARIVVFQIDFPIIAGYPVVLHYHSLTEQAHIRRLFSQLNKNTGEVIKKNPRCLIKNTTGEVEIEVNRPICLELYKNSKELGRVMLRAAGSTIAAGMVTEIRHHKQKQDIT